MALEIFKTNIAKPQQAKLLLQLLRQRISDGIIEFHLREKVHVFHIQTNREISEIAKAIFIKEGFDCVKL